MQRDGLVGHYISFPTQIQHIVVIVMENRTVDNLFAGYYNQKFPNPNYPTWQQALNLYNPAGPAPNPTLTPMALEANIDPSHSHGVKGLMTGGFENELNNGFGDETFGCPPQTANGNPNCSQPATAFAYVPTSETGPYAQLITNWAFANNLYQANEGPSFVAHQYLIAAQSGGIPQSLSAPNAEAENPGTPSPQTQIFPEDPAAMINATGGCDVKASDHPLDMAIGQNQNDLNNPTIIPCEEYANNTILDETVSITTPPFQAWQFIAATQSSIWSAPIGVNHLYQNYVNGYKPSQPFAVDPNAVNFAANLYGQGNPSRPFAALTYVTPCLGNSDHPGATNYDNGPQWVGWLVNQIGESSYWNSTAILITWDDWGGWFDHVVPQFPLPNAYSVAYGNPAKPDANEWGYRVPLIVISPYTPKAYVSQPTSANGVSTRSQSAILQYIEATFSLPSLMGDDFYQNQQNGEPTDFLKDMFNYSTQPRSYVPVTGVGSTPPPCKGP